MGVSASWVHGNANVKQVQEHIPAAPFRADWAVRVRVCSQHCEQKVHCSCVCGKCNWCTVPQAERWHSAALPAGRNHPAEPSSLAGLASHSACPLSRRLLVQTASNALWGGIAVWSPCVSAFWRLPGCQISATQPPQACGGLLPRPALFHICLTLPTLDQHPDRHEV